MVLHPHLVRTQMLHVHQLAVHEVVVLGVVGDEGVILETVVFRVEAP